MGYYVNDHRSQYDPGSSATTRTSGCTWTTAANGIDASTGGAVNMSPDEVHNLLDPVDETNPESPGWSIADVDRAMNRIGIPFSQRSGSGWAAVEQAHDAGLYIVLQGDSDQFGNSTCSGAFNGDHAVGVHPREREDGSWWIDDPICAEGRWESRKTLRLYAEKLYQYVYFGTFTDPVKQEGDMKNPKVNVTGSFHGNLRVLGDNRPAVQLQDGQVFLFNDGAVKPCYAQGNLAEPFVIGDTTVAAGTPVVLTGTEIAFFLKHNVELEPATDPHAVTIDGVSYGPIA